MLPTTSHADWPLVQRHRVFISRRRKFASDAGSPSRSAWRISGIAPWKTAGSVSTGYVPIESYRTLQQIFFMAWFNAVNNMDFAFEANSCLKGARKQFACCNSTVLLAVTQAISLRSSLRSFHHFLIFLTTSVLLLERMYSSRLIHSMKLSSKVFAKRKKKPCLEFSHSSSFYFLFCWIGEGCAINFVSQRVFHKDWDKMRKAFHRLEINIWQKVTR